VKPAQPNEKGWKDTFIMYPGEVTTVVIRFAPTDLPLNSDPEDLVYDFDPAEGPGYVWHCHIIDHEDNEMMRPYRVISSPYRSEPSAPLSVSPGNGDPNKGVVLEQNRPNPVVEATNIRFSLQEATRVKLALLSPAGEELYTILNTDVPAGIHSVRLDVSGLANGIYLYRLEAGSFSQTKKLVVVK
jgi:hypothetical protein